MQSCYVFQKAKMSIGGDYYALIKLTQFPLMREKGFDVNAGVLKEASIHLIN